MSTTDESELHLQPLPGPIRIHFTDQAPMPGNVLQTVVDLDAYTGNSGRMDTTDPEKAQVSTSIVDKLSYGDVDQRVHRPVLDIDFPAKLIESSTPGHFHLYLDVEIEHRKYMALLVALEDAGILEPGYVSASVERGYTAVRLPWVRKPDPRCQELVHESPATAAVPGAPF